MEKGDGSGGYCDAKCEEYEDQLLLSELKAKKEKRDKTNNDALRKKLEQQFALCAKSPLADGCRPETVASETPAGSSVLDELIQIVDFGAESLDLLDLIEDGVQYGRPLYRQIKYAIPLGGYEYGIDGLLQLYDDRNKNLTPAQRIMRGLVRGGESAFTDAASIGMGAISAAALQAGVPIPGVPAGVGYVVGSYSTSFIIDKAIVNQLNPWMFDNRFLGGP